MPSPLPFIGKRWPFPPNATKFGFRLTKYIIFSPNLCLKNVIIGLSNCNTPRAFIWIKKSANYTYHNWATSRQKQPCGCAPNEDSDPPGHLPSLIRVFAVRMKILWVLSYPLSTQQTLISLGRCPGWSESSLGTHSFCWFMAHMLNSKTDQEPPNTQQP